MYEKYRQHPELIRLIGAAAVSERFSQTLLQDPEQVLEGGCLGYQFDLTAEETALVKDTEAETIQEFALQVWAWMGRNGDGARNNSGQPIEGSFEEVEPFEKASVGSPVSMGSASVHEGEKVALHLFASQSTPMSWNRRVTMFPLILIVDDNREMAEGLRFALEIEGFQVVLASDGEAAIRFLERQRPDLILADIKMPRMDGYAFLRLVKGNPEWRDIPFVFVTATADWREAVTAKSRGADEYVVKPFELEDLVRVVRRLTEAVRAVRVRSGGEMGLKADQVPYRSPPKW